MERDRTLKFTPVDHPDARVCRIGFDLTDPYVELCWSAVIGPSSTLPLRRFPTLWVTGVPALIDAGELSRSLRLGTVVGERSRLASTLERLVTVDLARPAPKGTGLDVYRQVPPLTQRQLARLPDWTRYTEERLLGERLTQVEDSHPPPGERRVAHRAPQPPPARRRARSRRPHAARSGHRVMALTRQPGSPGTPASPGAHVGAEREVQRSHVDRFPCGKPVGRPVGGVR